MDEVVVVFLSDAKPGHVLVVSVISLPLGATRVFWVIIELAPQISLREGRAEAEVKRTARLTSVAVKRISVDSIERAAAEVQKMTSSRLYTIQERKLQK